MHYRSAQVGRLEDLHPEFASFFKQFFQVKDHPLGAPYIKIFTEQKPSTNNLWLNENVAGSYAPSSLRAGQPFRQVVNIENRAYSLPEDHAELAFEHLLYSQHVNAIDLAVFLYRDYGFSGEGFSLRDLTKIFAFEFGFSQGINTEPNLDFYTLFDNEPRGEWDTGWLMPL